MRYSLNIDLIEQRLAAKGYNSLSALAATGVVHRNTLKPYLAGEKSPFASVLERLAETLGVTPLQLIVTDTREARLLRAIEAKAQGFLLAGQGRALIMFGSRARGTHQEFSDLDLGVTGGEISITDSDFLELQRMLDDVLEDAPLCVDLVNFDVAPQEFLLKIAPDLRFLSGAEGKFYYLKGFIDGRAKA